jgi:hypothetical protein
MLLHNTVHLVKGALWHSQTAPTWLGVVMQNVAGATQASCRYGNTKSGLCCRLLSLTAACYQLSRQLPSSWCGEGCAVLQQHCTLPVLTVSLLSTDASATKMPPRKQPARGKTRRLCCVTHCRCVACQRLRASLCPAPLQGS